MNKRAIVLTLVFSAFIITLAGASGKKDGQEPPEPVRGASVEHAPVVITDIMGRTVTLPFPASRLVGTHNPTMNIAVILGGGGKYIAGFGNKNMAGGLYGYVFPELEDVPQIGMRNEINIESCLKAGADLAILPERFANQAQLFESAGIKAAVILPNEESFETIKSSLTLLGTLLGEEERAAKIVSFFDARVAEARNLAGRSARKPRALFLGGSSPLSAANGSMLQSLMLETAGALNVAGELSGGGAYVELSIEEIIRWNPERIYVPAFAQYKIEDILNDAAWSSIDAVRNRRVYEFPSALEPWDYPTPSAAIGLAWLLHNLYPESYTLEQVISGANEYYGLVYGKTFSAEQLGLK